MLGGGVRLAAVVGALFAAPQAGAQDALLSEVVDFSGTIAYLSSGAPGFVLAAFRDGETAFAGFGETAEGSGKAPDADTIMRIGSISKVFCGTTLASLAADGSLALTDPAQKHIDALTVPEKDGRAVRIIDLATHSSGLPREVPRPDASADDPFGTNTPAAQKAGLEGDPFLFAPGSAVLYSNWGFDVLGMALAGAGGKPYAELLQERVLDPLGMADTRLNPPPEDEDRLMQGHDFDGAPMPFVPTPETIGCAGGLHTSANDMLKWMRWQLDREAAADAELRLIDHAAYLYRDGLDTVAGLDDGGTMDAMGLGWVVMMPQGDRPLILQKSGGLQGMFAYVALAPTRGVGVFAALNAFSVSGFDAMVQTVNEMVAELAPR
jgi:serine-type D-Ala-D-Ala carboxypeptidase/endopeptidase